MVKKNAWKKCDKCGKLARELTFWNGQFLCGRCHKSGKTIKKKK